MSYTPLRDNDGIGATFGATGAISGNISANAGSIGVGPPGASLRLTAPSSVIGLPASKPEMPRQTEMPRQHKNNRATCASPTHNHPLPPFSLWVTQDDDNNNNNSNNNNNNNNN